MEYSRTGGHRGHGSQHGGTEGTGTHGENKRNSSVGRLADTEPSRIPVGSVPPC